MAAKKKSSKSPKKKTAPKKAPAKKKVVAKKPAKKAAPKKKVAKAAPKKKVAKAAPKKVAKAAPKKVAKAAPKKVAAPKKASAKPAAKPAKKVAPTQKVMARLAAEQVARSIVHEPHAFVEGKVTSDTLAEELAEDAVLAMTSGEDEEGERDGETEAEKGGPFVVSSGRVEYADDDEAPNIASAEVAGTPTTRDEDEAEDEG